MLAKYRSDSARIKLSTVTGIGAPGDDWAWACLTIAAVVDKAMAKASELAFMVRLLGRFNSPHGGAASSTVRRGFRLKPVKTQDHEEPTIRRRQPVCLFVRAGCVVLDTERHAAVGVTPQVRQHWRIDQVAIERIGRKQA